MVLWGTLVGKKVVMAVTGLVLVGFVIAHMVGNLKIFLGAEAIDSYAVFLRTMGEPMFPPGRCCGWPASCSSPASRCTSPRPSS